MRSSALVILIKMTALCIAFLAKESKDLNNQRIESLEILEVQ
jgi:hypothetical protein